jgi:hypothetical protein
LPATAAVVAVLAAVAAVAVKEASLLRSRSKSSNNGKSPYPGPAENSKSRKLRLAGFLFARKRKIPETCRVCGNLAGNFREIFLRTGKLYRNLFQLSIAAVTLQTATRRVPGRDLSRRKP